MRMERLSLEQGNIEGPPILTDEPEKKRLTSKVSPKETD